MKTQRGRQRGIPMVRESLLRRQREKAEREAGYAVQAGKTGNDYSVQDLFSETERFWSERNGWKLHVRNSVDKAECGSVESLEKLVREAKKMDLSGDGDAKFRKMTVGYLTSVLAEKHWETKKEWYKTHLFDDLEYALLDPEEIYVGILGDAADNVARGFSAGTLVAGKAGNYFGEGQTGGRMIANSTGIRPAENQSKGEFYILKEPGKFAGLNKTGGLLFIGGTPGTGMLAGATGGSLILNRDWRSVKPLLGKYRNTKVYASASNSKAVEEAKQKVSSVMESYAQGCIPKPAAEEYLPCHNAMRALDRILEDAEAGNRIVKSESAIEKFEKERKTVSASLGLELGGGNSEEDGEDEESEEDGVESGSEPGEENGGEDAGDIPANGRGTERPPYVPRNSNLEMTLVDAYKEKQRLKGKKRVSEWPASRKLRTLIKETEIAIAQKGMTQTEFCSRIGISPPSFSTAKHGKGLLKEDHIEALIGALGKPEGTLGYILDDSRPFEDIPVALLKDPLPKPGRKLRSDILIKYAKEYSRTHRNIENKDQPANVKISGLLNDYLEQTGKTKHGMAEEIGLNPGLFSYYLMGLTFPRTHLGEILDFLGLPRKEAVEYLFEDSIPPRKQAFGPAVPDASKPAAEGTSEKTEKSSGDGAGVDVRKRTVLLRTLRLDDVSAA